MEKNQSDYNQGFLDATELLLESSNKITDSGTPQEKRFSILISAIEHAYQCACELHVEDVKRHFLISWEPEMSSCDNEKAVAPTTA